MHNKLKKSRMTLIEVMIAMVILVIIMGFLTMMISKVQLVTRSNNRKTDIYEQQRLFFDILARDLESIVVLEVDEDLEIETTSDQKVPIQCIFINGEGIAFITTSGIGLTETDTSLFLEVKYEFDSASGELTRYYTSQKHNNGGGTAWNYKTNKQFYLTMGDETVILEGVRSFEIKMYDIENNELPTGYDSWVLPAYVEFKMTVVPPELKDDTSIGENQFRYSFSKVIYFHNGELE